MSVRYIAFSGAETGGLEEWISAGTGLSSVFITDRAGNFCYTYTRGAALSTSQLVSAASDTLSVKSIIGFAFKYTGTPSNSQSSRIFGLDASATVSSLNIYLASDASGNVTLKYDNGTGSPSTITTSTLTADTWYYVECYHYYDSTAGAIELFLNGASQGSFSSIVTSGSTIATQYFYSTLTGAVNLTYSFDDFYCITGVSSSADRLGSCEVRAYQNSTPTTTPDLAMLGTGVLDTGVWLNSAGVMDSDAYSMSYTNTPLGGVVYADAAGPTHFKWVDVAVTTSNTNGVCHGATDNEYVAVGNLGFLGRSDDGSKWQVASSKGGVIDESMEDVCWNPTDNEYVAVGASGVVVYSTNGGVNWTAASTNPFAGTYNLRDVCYNVTNGTYVAVGFTGSIGYSTDGGVTWTLCSLPTTLGTDQLNAVCWNATDNKYIVVSNVGRIGIASGASPCTWTLATTPSFGGTGINGVCWNSVDNEYVAVGNTGKIAYSTDGGVTWTQASSTGTTGSIYSVCHNPVDNTYTAVGPSGYCAYSADGGDTWLEVVDGYTEIAGERNIFDVCYNSVDNNFVSTGSGGRAAVSVRRSGPSGQGLSGAIVAANHIWTAERGNGGGTVHYLYHGYSGDTVTEIANITPSITGSPAVYTKQTPHYMTWRNASSHNFGTNIIYSVCYNPTSDVFVAVGQNGKIEYSSDGGSTWTAATTPSFGTTTITAVVWDYTNNKYLAGGYSGKIASSTDGDTWTQLTSPTTLDVDNIVYGGGQYLMSASLINQPTYVGYSTDGINWTTSLASFGTLGAASMAYDPLHDRFWIGLSGRLLAYSTTGGETWTQVTNTTFSSASDVFYAIAYSKLHDRIIVGGSSGQLAWAPGSDPQAFTSITTFTTDQIRSLAYDEYSGMLYAGVSVSSTFAYSYDGIVWAVYPAGYIYSGGRYPVWGASDPSSGNVVLVGVSGGLVHSFASIPNTEYVAQGAGVDGAKDLIIHQMWAMLLHIPASGVTYNESVTLAGKLLSSIAQDALLGASTTLSHKMLTAMAAQWSGNVDTTLGITHDAAEVGNVDYAGTDIDVSLGALLAQEQVGGWFATVAVALGVNLASPVTQDAILGAATSLGLQLAQAQSTVADYHLSAILAHALDVPDGVDANLYMESALTLIHSLSVASGAEWTTDALTTLSLELGVDHAATLGILAALTLSIRQFGPEGAESSELNPDTGFDQPSYWE